MLSNLIISNQKFVLIIDNLGHERIASKTIFGLLEEQGQSDSIKSLSLSRSDTSSNESFYKTFLDECESNVSKTNVLLPNLSDISLYYPNKADLFYLIHQLKQCRNVKQIFLWASTKHLFETFTLACLEYMADVVLCIEDRFNLSILSRKPGGSVTNKIYTYTRAKDSFQVEPVKKSPKKPEKSEAKPEQTGTFKIELEEDELVARNALKMPYEKMSEDAKEGGDGGGNIIYTPDKEDDFDEEDPDEDLYI